MDADFNLFKYTNVVSIQGGVRYRGIPEIVKLMDKILLKIGL
jgi:hypothetical protein